MIHVRNFAQQLYGPRILSGSLCPDSQHHSAGRTSSRSPALPASCPGSNDVPDILGGVTELAACHARTQAVVADADSILDDGISKVIVSLGHGSDKYADALLVAQICNVVLHPNDGSVETQGDLPAAWWQMIGDGVLDHLQELLLRVGGPDRQSMQQLDHEAGKALEGPRNAHRGTDLNQNASRGVDVDLELPSLVDRGVQQGQQTLAARSAESQLWPSVEQTRIIPDG